MGKLVQVVMMLATQILLAGNVILYKVAGINGYSLPVLIAYRFVLATAIFVPLVLIFERRRPRLTWRILLQAFACALFGGSLIQNLLSKSIVLTSATFTSAIFNLIPAVTFILSILLRMEALGLNTMVGKAKVAGTIVGIGGAMVLTFYKGCEIDILSTHLDILHWSQPKAAAHSHHKNYTLGLIMVLACCFSVSLSLIVMGKMSAAYPCPYTSMVLISIFGLIQSVIYALCVERDWKQWELKFDLELLIVLYLGILISGVVNLFNMLCVRMRGPLFVSVFTPLQLVFVAIAGDLFLNEKLHLGSVVGAVVIISGLYVVLWAKNKEIKKVNGLEARSEDAITNGSTSQV